MKKRMRKKRVKRLIEKYKELMLTDKDWILQLIDYKTVEELEKNLKEKSY